MAFAMELKVESFLSLVFGILYRVVSGNTSLCLYTRHVTAMLSGIVVFIMYHHAIHNPSTLCWSCRLGLGLLFVVNSNIREIFAIRHLRPPSSSRCSSWDRKISYRKIFGDLIESIATCMVMCYIILDLMDQGIWLMDGYINNTSGYKSVEEERVEGCKLWKT